MINVIAQTKTSRGAGTRRDRERERDASDVDASHIAAPLRGAAGRGRVQYTVGEPRRERAPSPRPARAPRDANAQTARVALVFAFGFYSRFASVESNYRPGDRLRRFRLQPWCSKNMIRRDTIRYCILDYFTITLPTTRRYRIRYLASSLPVSARQNTLGARPSSQYR